MANYKELDVEATLAELRLEEKISLLSGTDFWHTAAIERLEIPAIRVSDGPNGVRGTKFFDGAPAACFPCGTAIGATWDQELVEKAGALQAKEAIAKGASAILGPTVNIQRSPLGGRGFESFSEDPVLTGKIAAATIRGIQSHGVGATIKHFVCNDQEDHRQSADSVVSGRALREIYLKAFQIAQREASPLCYMSAYNKTNGLHCSEDPFLLDTVLRKEWGFNGMIMSDWFGTYSTVAAIKAGLDLEMPGPTSQRGGLLAKAVSSGLLSELDIDRCTRRVLSFIKQSMKLNLPENAPETTIDSPETAATLRTIAANGIVLLKNDRNVLPLKKDKEIGVIGPNVNMAAYCGGGSASLQAYYTITPLEGIQKVNPSVKYTLGCPGWQKLPLLSNLTFTESREMGLDMRVYLSPPSEANREAIDHIHVEKSDIILIDYKHPKIHSFLFYVDFEGFFTCHESAEYIFSLTVAGTAKLYIDDQLVVDNETKQTVGDSFFGSGTIEERGNIKLEESRTYKIKVHYATSPTQTVQKPGATVMGPGGITIGATKKVDLEEELARAKELAREVDQIVICAGLNADWESEGYDRPHMDLPPGSDALIEAVSEINPKVVVVIQSGTPVTMPWANKVAAIVQAWYGGNECGNAITDVLYGDVNPSGKLPLSFPVRVQDNPAYLNTVSQRNRIIYGEDVYVGYRYYEACQREVLFPFGHGLSYTEFKMYALSVKQEKENIVVSVKVHNTGNLAGSEVVQVYAHQEAASVPRPPKELVGFTKIHLKAGSSETVEVTVRKRDVTSFWDEEREAWTEEKGEYKILVGNSSASTPLEAIFSIEKTSWWNGL